MRDFVTPVRGQLRPERDVLGATMAYQIHNVRFAS